MPVTQLFLEPVVAVPPVRAQPQEHADNGERPPDQLGHARDVEGDEQDTHDSGHDAVHSETSSGPQQERISGDLLFPRLVCVRGDAGLRHASHLLT